MEDIQALQLGRSEPTAPINLAGVDRLGEKLGRQVRLLLEPYFGAKPMVAVRPAETINFDLWSAMAPGFASLNVYRLSPLKGMMLLKMDPQMVSVLVDRFFGGSTGRPSQRNEFTYGEERIIARVADAVMDALVSSWRELVELEVSLVGRETDPQALAIAETNDQMLVQTIDIRLGKEEPWAIDLMFPVVSLRQIEPLLAQGGLGEGCPDPLWRARLADRMQDIPLPARTVLARPTLQIDELMELKPGDIIPVSIARSLPLIVGSRVIAHGTVGEQNGHAAFRIEKLN